MFVAIALETGKTPGVEIPRELPKPIGIAPGIDIPVEIRKSAGSSHLLFFLSQILNLASVYISVEYQNLQQVPVGYIRYIIIYSTF